LRISRLAAAAVLVTWWCTGVAAEETRDSACRDSVVIDTVTYRIPAWWCEWKIDSADLADPTRLVRLPGKFCELDYRIYLQRDARDAFVRMAEAALADSGGFLVRSGYRSPEYQRKVLRQRMAAGQTFRDIMWSVAPPGYSQHHTGRAVDLTTDEETSLAFSRRRAYAWLKKNAGRYGYYETYSPAAKPPPASEPWHWYYRGSDETTEQKPATD